MKKELAFLLLFAFVAFSFVSAQTEVSYFYGVGCPHCANVAASGVLERVSGMENVTLTKYEIYYNETSRNKFYDLGNKLGLKRTNMGVPLVVINSSGTLSYLAGDKPIINQLESSIKTGEGAGNTNENVSPTHPDAYKITLGGIIFAALVDSINPCAFGVLIFLMISLLKIGSSKRALKAGLIYTSVVFVVYFFSGLGLFKTIQSFPSITRTIYLSSGILVLIVGFLELVDFIRKDKESIVKISKRVKPLMEKFTHKGTVPAIIVLGILVSLFELPCTGGIYLAILATMSINKTFAIGYLLLYNLIFVLPLIILTLLIYKGTSPERLQKWTNSEKKWMKLSAGLLMVVLGVYILYSAL
jgi:cytochrome c biogenesis protein CcdA